MLTLRRAVSEGCTANKILTLKEKIMKGHSLNITKSAN